MRNRVFSGLIFAFTVLLALPTSAQQNSAQPSLAAAAHPAKVPQLPYTAEYKETRVQTLANGATLTHASTERRVVDSEGRILTISIRLSHSENQETVSHYLVFDPVAGKSLSWDSPTAQKVVTVNPVGVQRQQACASSPATASGGSQEGSHAVVSAPIPKLYALPATEDLGKAMIFGTEVRGTKIIRTMPVGQIDNDEPLVSTAEIWSATEPGLHHMFVKQVSDDPWLGKSVKELVHFEQGEPDPASFQPPEGYKIVEKKPKGCPGAAAVTTPAQ